MLKSLSILLVSLLSSTATVTDCGAGKSIFQIKAQNFSPEPPVANEAYDYWFTYVVPDGVSVSSGTTKYTLTLNGIPFTPQVDDLCTQTACPKEAGFHNESSTDTWPSGISGKIVTKLEWFDSNGNLLLCSSTTERV